MPTHYLYLLTLLGSVLFPFLLSFVKGVSFYKKWKALFVAHFSVAILFCIWDAAFTSQKIWGFNADYILGFYLYNLPLEEVLFFIIIPYCCLFIYESLRHHFQLNFDTRRFFLAFSLLSLALAINNYDKMYTLSSFGICSIICAYFFIKRYSWSASFLVSFIISMLPFLLVNGILTGGFTESPVVWYNDAENMAIRIGSIPIEDISYGFDLLAMNMIAYEYLKSKKYFLTNH